MMVVASTTVDLARLQFQTPVETLADRPRATTAGST
jgi:hypothetical protein